ncbi:PREDICTED: glycine-rich cell wall structural protein 1.0-like [Populus euphratica]|uniref:Glycine-rich cell wall structural protein 1.0-like n=1 Tax=Populus euphratica TaxID=75702 RepID=A0AAJ6TJG0_POPEU|nr:PREDICTED: glycine-rich cell wall structural protein 1.0-like [Populus euphratica]
MAVNQVSFEPKAALNHMVHRLARKVDGCDTDYGGCQGSNGVGGASGRNCDDNGGDFDCGQDQCGVGNNGESSSVGGGGRGSGGFGSGFGFGGGSYGGGGGGGGGSGYEGGGGGAGGSGGGGGGGGGGVGSGGGGGGGKVRGAPS